MSLFKYYAYGFNIILSEKRITGEWLYDITNNDEELVFERDIEHQKFDSKIVFKDIYMWFSRTLDINYADEPITNFQYLLGEDTTFNSSIVKILDMFGTGITDFKLIDSTI